MVQSHPAFGSFNPKVFIWTFLDKFQTYKLLLCLFLISDATGMQISRPYTVVLPSLQVDPSEREFDGRRFYLMIKLYPEGTLTPTLNPVVAGEFHNFQHSPSVLGGLLPPWVFKSKTMSLKLWLTVKEFSLLKKICINDEKLVHLYGSIISKFFLSHLAVRGANLFQGTLTIANVKVFFI